MKRSLRFLSILLTLCIVLGLFPATVFAAGSMPFTDVKETDWFYDAVRYVYENGMMSGTGSTTFSPDIVTTRGMIVTILHRMEGTPAATGEEFADVPTGEYYSEAVAWASANGIVSGYGDGNFGPDDAITREQMAAILYRYAQYKGYDTSSNGSVLAFADGSNVSSYAVDAMGWAVGTGLISGVGGTMLDPTGSATRAQVATILMRFCEYGFEAEAYGFTVVFKYNYGNKGVYRTVIVGAGKTVNKPSNPVRNGYTFDGWYTEDGSKYDFNSAVLGNLTLYAEWKEKSTNVHPELGLDGSGNKDKTEADDYFENNSEIVGTVDVEKSREVPTETEVKSLLEERGFVDYPVIYEFAIDGEYIGETEVIEGSTDRHPIYTTYYLSANNEVWTVHVINGKVFAYPASFNLQSDLSAELLVSESELITSYDSESNRFFVTIPSESGAIVITVDRIDAETLDELSIEALCEMSGATLPSSDDGDNDAVAAYALIDYDTLANTASLNDYVALASTSTGNGSDDPVVIVSLGDSYSSGEGNEPFYGQEKSLAEKVLDYDWLAHRSKVSWGALLQTPTMKDRGIRTGDCHVKYGTQSSICKWYFAAASGATTEHFKNEHEKPYKKKASNIIFWYLEGMTPLPAQLSVFNDIDEEVDYVTLTIGGNDADFSDVITTCALRSTYLGSKKLEKKLAEIWNKIDSIMAKIKQVYKDIEERAGEQAAIIVAGYPKLLDQNGKGFLISENEAMQVNNKVSAFNAEIALLVNRCQEEGMNVYFADVEEAFDGHEAYSDEPWINEIMMPSKTQDIKEDVKSAYSMHPNLEGQIAYAESVNSVIAALENSKTISGVITIADEDTDMTNNLPLEGAEISISISGVQKRTAISDANGEYKLTNIPCGSYMINVSKEGYFPVSDRIRVSEGASEIIYNKTIEAISTDYAGIGYASGKIFDVATGRPVSGLTLYIRKGLGNTTGTVVSTIHMNNSTIWSTVDGLPAGNYTVEVVDERTGISDEARYLTTSYSIKVLGGITIGDQNGYVSNTLGSEEIRIVLTWGSAPSDLDSHLVGPDGSGGKFHVYYGNKTYGSTVDLDVDDTSSWGPETVTIHDFNDGIYTYAVHDYTNKSSSYSTAMSNSGAQVVVWRGAEVIATYNVPVNKDGTLWTVFTYDSVTKQFTTVNKMTYDTSSGGSLMSVDLSDGEVSEVYEYECAVCLITEDVYTNTK